MCARMSRDGLILKEGGVVVQLREWTIKGGLNIHIRSRITNKSYLKSGR
jgi:hypothetical protein